MSVVNHELDGQPNILDKVYALLEPLLSHGYHIALQKEIPIGGGLGGGSSNAAALISWLNEFEALGMTEKTRMALGAKIGADVPFFIQGGTALVRGIGEKITPLSCKVPPWYVLINPRKLLSTALVYGNYDRALTRTLTPGPTPRRIRSGAVGENWFKPVVWECLPELKSLEAWAADSLNQPLFLSGSGATVFISCDSEGQARQFTALIEAQFPGYWVLPVSIK